MIVFKTLWKIVLKYKFTVILYTALLVIFAGVNIKTSDTSTNFVASEPNVLIIDNDSENKITQNLKNYITDNCNIVDIKDDEDSINDALFYRDVNYIIYIPQNYGEDFLNKVDPKIEIKSTGDYQASLAEMMLKRYINVANTYITQTQDEEELISKINDVLGKDTKIEITSKLDTNNLWKASFYYNFLSYSILAGLVYVICLIISSFRQENVRKRTIISSTNYKKHNFDLLLSNSIFAIALWMVYVALSFIVVGDIMFSLHGLVLIINSFVFSICALCIAFLVANVVNNKNAINGIINVIGLGSSFLCGAFVPVEWLPDSVLKVAHILPSYWYIQTNETLKTLETINVENLKPIFINMAIILGFSVLFIIISNVVSKRKRKID